MEQIFIQRRSFRDFTGERRKASSGMDAAILEKPAGVEARRALQPLIVSKGAGEQMVLMHSSPSQSRNTPMMPRESSVLSELVVPGPASRLPRQHFQELRKTAWQRVCLHPVAAALSFLLFGINMKPQKWEHVFPIACMTSQRRTRCSSNTFSCRDSINRPLSSSCGHTSFTEK